jgi:aminoglycoside 6'-N-acetyltransferase I
MSDIHIRRARPTHRPALAVLRHALWPDSSVEEHERELAPILDGKPPGILPLVVFVAEAPERAIIGFVEVGLRSAADHCDWSHPVGYVEGWYVAEGHRRRGVGAQLIAAAENWAHEQGCVEMASDTQLDNELSQRAHQQLGYQIVERVILFRKPLR